MIVVQFFVTIQIFMVVILFFLVFFISNEPVIRKVVNEVSDLIFLVSLLVSLVTMIFDTNTGLGLFFVTFFQN
jgi:hypothetical protein